MNMVRIYLNGNSINIQRATTLAIDKIRWPVWPHIFAALDNLCADAREPPIEYEVYHTHETLEDFVHSSMRCWPKAGRLVRLTFGAYPAVKFLRFQMRLGQPWANMLVLDLGEFRVILK